jgi:hypothetical protein
MDITIDKQGRILVGYADGCLACTNSTNAQSTSALATIARECGGRGLFSQFDSLLAVSACSGGGPTPTPTATPPADSCNGVNVITDALGDVVNPAPGGQGPTSQADIGALSFSANPTTLRTTMKIAKKIANLSQTPSPGTTFTSYLTRLLAAPPFIASQP